MIELLVVILMVGILSAIAAPGWLGFMENQRLKSASGTSLAAIRLAQSKATQERRSYQASFRTTSTGTVQFAVHPTDSSGNSNALSKAASVVSWENYSSNNVRIHTADNTKTSLNTGSNGGLTYYWIAFDYNGNYVDTDGDALTAPAGNLTTRITFSSASGSNNRRCVNLTTLLGSISLNSDTQPTVNADQDCQDS